MELSHSTLRLFPDYSRSSLESAEARAFVVTRLLEDGDTADLSDLFQSLGETEVRAILRLRVRQLSRRSRAFWIQVLDEKLAVSRSPAETDVWPL